MDTVERIALPDVTLACNVAGDGPLVLAVHGFPDDATTFRGQVSALVAAGYRVVAPTLRGYAPSGVAKSGHYDPTAVAADLLALADHYSPDAPVRLLGHDWGAVAAFAAVAKAPSRFSHLATIAVPHLAAAARCLATPAQLRRSWYIGFFQLPIAPELALRANDLALIDRLVRAWSPDWHPSPDELASIKEGIRDRVGPVLAYYRSLRDPRALAGEPRRLLFAPVRVPAVHIHGANDGCMGIECAEGAERHYRAGYTFHRIEGAGHFVQREKPAEVGALLLDFFERG